MIDRYNLIFSLYLGQVDAVQVQHISLANNITYLPRLLQEMDEIAGFFFFIYYQPQYKSAISAAELAKKGLPVGPVWPAKNHRTTYIRLGNSNSLGNLRKVIGGYRSVTLLPVIPFTQMNNW